MNKTPEHIEREMFEIRTRMAPNIADLQHNIQPAVVKEKVKRNLMQRLHALLNSAKAMLRHKQEELQQMAGRQFREIQEAAEEQFRLAQEAGKTRNPSLVTDAVKSDPRPLAALAFILAVVIFLVRSLTSVSEDE